MNSVKPKPSVVFQEVEGEMVLLDLDREMYFALDPVGTRCWQLLAEHGDVERIVATMVAEYDVDEHTFRHDFGDLIARLEAAELVVRADTA
jgi:hypothetical protein